MLAHKVTGCSVSGEMRAYLDPIAVVTLSAVFTETQLARHDYLHMRITPWSLDADIWAGRAIIYLESSL